MAVRCLGQHLRRCAAASLALGLAAVLLPGETLARPARGGVGGPASGAGVRPGAGWGAPGVGLTRAPAAAYGAAVYHPGWAGGGYWGARPWTTGWYGARPLAWGVAGLATGATIAAAVNSAAAQQSTLIVVPQTTVQLNYATVVGLPPSGVRFSYLVDGVSQAAQGDCQGGQLNGQPASSPQAAQLLNAACVVAYGSGQ